MGTFLLVAAVVVLLVLGWIASGSLPERPGQELASVAVEPGRPIELSFDAPAARDCAVWLSIDVERARDARAIAGVQVAVTLRAGGRVLLSHDGFSIDDRAASGSPFVGKVGIVAVNTYVGGAFVYRSTALVVPIEEPPGTPMVVSVRVTPNPGTTAHSLRLFAACATVKGKVIPR